MQNKADKMDGISFCQFYANAVYEKSRMIFLL